LREIDDETVSVQIALQGSRLSRAGNKHAGNEGGGGVRRDRL